MECTVLLLNLYRVVCLKSIMEIRLSIIMALRLFLPSKSLLSLSCSCIFIWAFFVAEAKDVFLICEFLNGYTRSSQSRPNNSVRSQLVIDKTCQSDIVGFFLHLAQVRQLTNSFDGVVEMRVSVIVEALG